MELAAPHDPGFADEETDAVKEEGVLKVGASGTHRPWTSHLASFVLHAA